MQRYSLNKASDVYSIGVLLWEISSGQLPFREELYDICLVNQITEGYRETMVPDTPTDYFNLYTECWNDEPNNRPLINQVIIRLQAIIANKDINCNINVQLSNKQFITDLLSTNNSSQDGFSQMIVVQNFNEMKIESMTINIDETISVIIDGLFILIFKEINEGKEEKIKKKYVLVYINNCKLSLQESYEWLSDNQNNSNSIYLLGYFNYHEIETNNNKQKAIKLYQKAANLENSIA
ncbi:hypothetical protein C1645_824095 [Glomus cerebriforme]|uniref:Protein kinase domain-containing protein n=1 Tax=Glomus cerebriforme TaxID=658196 RepID=A0A397T0Z8_9GLOM|nr:hypothetical protein C1645_824095 [Glomus cerebriforme]